MRFVTFKNDKISKLSLGTVQFGLNYGIANRNGKPTETTIKEIINYVCSEGLNFFDTAQDYGNSEEILGNLLENKVDKLIISKVKSDFFKTNGKESLLKSLNYLKITSLYALLLHDSKLLHNWKEEYSIKINEFINCNKIKHFGVSIYTSEDFDLAINNDDIQIIQIPFNLFDQRAINEGWFKKAEEKNKLLFIRSIYLQGLLLMNKKDIPCSLINLKKYIDKIEELCDELNLSKNELSLSFVDSVAHTSPLLFGCDNLIQAKQNLYTFDNVKRMDNDTIKKINEKFKDVDESIYNPSMWNII